MKKVSLFLNNKTINDFYHSFFYMLLLFALVYLFGQIDYGRAVFIAFQQRDMSRTLELINGNLIFFGPEMTGGGFLPGPFYYYLMLLPMKLFTTWKSVWIFFNLLLIISIYSLSFIMKRIDGFLASLFVIGLAVSSQLINLVFINFINPSSLFIFFPIIVFLFIKIYEEVEIEKVFFALGGSLFIIGLSVQVHFISFFLYFSFIFFAFKFLRNLSFKKWLFLIMCLLLPYFPFWFGESVSRMIGLNFQIPYHTSYVRMDQSFQTIFNFYGFGKQEILFFLNRMFQVTMMVVPFCLPVILLIDFKRLYILKNCKWIKFFGILALTNLLPFLYTLFSVQTLRYATFFCMSIVCLSSLVISRLYHDANSNYKKGFILLTFIAGMYFQSLNLLKDLSTHLAPPLSNSEYESIIKIARKYGFDNPKSILSRVYFVNTHFEQDFRNVIEDQSFSSYDYLNDKKERGIDGFIFIKKVLEKKNGNLKSFLLSQNLPLEFQTALKEGHIALGRPMSSDFLLIPYKILRKENYKLRNFSNLSLGYNKVYNYQNLLAANDQEFTELQNGKYIFQWKECNVGDFYCNIGIELSLSKEGEFIKGHAIFFGGLISQSSPWISPGLTGSLRNPYLKFLCNKNFNEIELINSIGFNRNTSRDLSKPLFLSNNAILAPAMVEFKILCKEGLNKIIFGRKDFVFEKINSIESKGAKEILSKLIVL